LLIITFDEGDDYGGKESNHIFTLFVGENVRHGSYNQKIDHYTVLRTIEEMYGLSYAGSSATSTAIDNVWKNLPQY
jgi:phosphatidylinositol-3-phosphatase